MVVLPGKEISLPFPRSNGANTSNAGSIGRDIIKAIEDHNASVTDDEMKLAVPSAKPAVYSGYILSTVRDAFKATAVSQDVGVLTLQGMQLKYSDKQYKRAYEFVRDEMFRSFPVFKYTELNWGLKRSMTIALQNKKNTNVRKEKRKNEKSKGKKTKNIDRAVVRRHNSEKENVGGDDDMEEEGSGNEEEIGAPLNRPEGMQPEDDEEEDYHGYGGGRQGRFNVEEEEEDSVPDRDEKMVTRSMTKLRRNWDQECHRPLKANQLARGVNAKRIRRLIKTICACRTVNYHLHNREKEATMPRTIIGQAKERDLVPTPVAISN